MAEALASLGVAAGIAQFVTLGLKGAVFLWGVYNSSDGLVKTQKELREISQSYQASYEALRKESSVNCSRNIKAMLEKSIALNLELDHEFNKLQRLAGSSSSLGKAKLLVRATWKRGAIDDITSRLEKLRSGIVFELVTLSHMSQSVFIKQLDSLGSEFDSKTSDAGRKIENLHKQLEDFEIRLLKASEDRKIELLTAMADETKSVVTYCLNRKRAEDILRSLHYEQLSERRSEIKPAHRKTFSWSLSEKATTLATWLRNENNIYWIQGKAGSGKSTLMKYLLKEERTRDLLQTWAKGRSLLVASHFFWGPGTKLQCDINGLYRTLLFQILMEHPELIDAVCTARMGKDGFRHLESWTTEELHTCFTSLATLETLPCKLCIFIDGLDEFRGDFTDLIRLVQALGDSEDIKICVASRPWVQFRDAFGESLWQLRVEDLTKEDIKNYIDNVLCADDRFMKLQQSMPEQSEFFQKEIATRADGVFFWVYLVTRNLLRGLTNDDDVFTLIRRLNQFPTDLEDYFMNMLMSIDDVYHAETSAIFSMLMYSPSSRLSVKLLWAYRISQPLVERATIKWNQTLGKRERNMILGVSGIDDSGRLPSHEFLQSIDRTLFNHHGREPIVMDPERELNYVSTICKDLVNTRAVDSEASGSDTVGFLHRSVADFLALPRTSALLERRLSSRFDVRIAICGAYLFLFRRLDRVTWMQARLLRPGNSVSSRSSRSSGSFQDPEDSQGSGDLEYQENQEDQEEKENLVLLMLYLLKQVRSDSTSSTSAQMILLVSTAIFEQYNGENLRVLPLDGLIESGDSRPLQVDQFRMLLAHMTGACSGTMTTTAVFGELFSQILNMLDSNGDWKSGCTMTGRCLDSLLVHEPVIILGGRSLNGVSRDLGRPKLRYRTFVNTKLVSTFLQDNEPKGVDGGSLVDPWPKFLQRQRKRIEAGETPVDNFLEVCRLLILHGAPKQIEGVKLLRDDDEPRVKLYDAAVVIWMIVTVDQTVRSEGLNFEDIEGMWPRTQQGAASSGGNELDNGGLLAVARRGWKMLPWT